MVFRRQLTSIRRGTALLCILNWFAISSVLAADCDINRGPCIKTAGKRTIIFDIAPKPVKAMEELTFVVKTEPCASLPETLTLDLGMPGMMMGKNQVVLRKQSDCTWSGKGIIVRCMSGRTLWRATLLSDALNNTAFTFDVKY